MRFLIAENLTMYVAGNQSIIWEELDTHGWGKAVSGESEEDFISRVTRENIESHYSAFESVEVR